MKKGKYKDILTRCPKQEDYYSGFYACGVYNAYVYDLEIWIKMQEKEIKQLQTLVDENLGF